MASQTARAIALSGMFGVPVSSRSELTTRSSTRVFATRITVTASVDGQDISRRAVVTSGSALLASLVASAVTTDAAFASERGGDERKKVLDKIRALREAALVTEPEPEPTPEPASEPEPVAETEEAEVAAESPVTESSLDDLTVADVAVVEEGSSGVATVAELPVADVPPFPEVDIAV
ncbi:hypothetical protein CLOM_g9294 [Closterium sp. NIES-68]|nr:hypothetical protein CLOM_g9294 [Closterium sp. NIES-68]GJP79929.1 hypothetical protein CLOP_g10143 [Closterium sp. NIES-67]